MNDYPEHGWPVARERPAPIGPWLDNAAIAHVERLCRDAADTLARAADLARAHNATAEMQVSIAAAMTHADAAATGKAAG